MLNKFLVGLCFALTTSTVLAEHWKFGIGTGLYGLAITGDGGFNTALGPVEFDADLDSGDVRDVLESAVGFGGYAKKDAFTITYSLGTLELENDVSAMRGDLSGNLKVNYEATKAEVAVDYAFIKEGRNSFGILVGLRYTKKKFNTDLIIDGVPSFSSSVDEHWTDLLLGITHSYPMSQTRVWTTRADVGFGGSEGSLFFDTGMTWAFSKSFAARFYGSIISHDFEEGDKGDPDWFFYDVNEYGLGISLIYNF